MDLRVARRCLRGVTVEHRTREGWRPDNLLSSTPSESIIFRFALPAFRKRSVAPQTPISRVKYALSVMLTSSGKGPEVRTWAGETGMGGLEQPQDRR